MRTRLSNQMLPNHISAVALELQRFGERTDGLHHLSKREPVRNKKGRGPALTPDIEIYLMEQQLARLIRLEAARRRYLPCQNEGADEWAVLLDLTLAHLRKETVFSGVLRNSLGMDEEGLWGCLARLERQGFVNGMYSPTQASRIVIWLTEFGMERMTRVLVAA